MARPRKPFGARLGERARARREKLGKTQTSVAEAAGISVSRLCHLERGRLKRGPAPETLARLASALEMPLSDLVRA